LATLLKPSSLASVLLVCAAALPADRLTRCGWVAPGTRFATPYFVRDSGRPGPTVVVVGGIHGDEPAGALAAAQIRHWTVRRGRLVVVPRANVPALEARRRRIPGVPDDQSNLNRNFPSKTKGPQPRGTLATALWNFVCRFRPDWLLDLHEGYGFHQLDPDTVGSSVIVFRDAETKRLAERLLQEINQTIPEKKKQFVRLSPPADGSLARAAGQLLGAHALILETTRRSQPLSLRTRQHRRLVHRVLVELGMRSEKDSFQQMTPRAAAPEGAGPFRRRRTNRSATCAGEPGRPPVYVALYDAGGTSQRSPAALLRLLRQWPQTEVAAVGPEEVRTALAQFDVVVFPGGSGSRQAAALGETGRERVRQFVRDGGGFVGICAGAYLACAGFRWGLKVLDAKTVSPKWRRGRAQVEIELTEAGQRLFGPHTGRLKVLYVNGPILEPAGRPDLPDYVTLAVFRSEVAKNNTPKGVMIGSPAVVSAPFGRGRVVCFSPHPEQTRGLEVFVLRAVLWAAGRPAASPQADGVRRVPSVETGRWLSRPNGRRPSVLSHLSQRVSLSLPLVHCPP